MPSLARWDWRSVERRPAPSAFGSWEGSEQGPLSRGCPSDKRRKALALGFIEATDIFLIGIVLFIFSLGLYILFIDDKLSLPAWLEIRDLDDLKGQLVSVVIAALAVIFLGHVVQWDGQPEILGLGAAIGLVVAARAFFLNTKPAKKE